MTRNARAIATTTILGYVDSSTAGKYYEVRRGDDGVMYCTCPHWPIAKNNGGTCKHMRGIMTGTVTLRPATTAPAPQAPTQPAPPATRRATGQRRRTRGPAVQPGPQPAPVTLTEVERINRALLSGTMSLTQSGMVTSRDVEDVL